MRTAPHLFPALGAQNPVKAAKSLQVDWVYSKKKQELDLGLAGSFSTLTFRKRLKTVDVLVGSLELGSHGMIFEYCF